MKLSKFFSLCSILIFSHQMVQADQDNRDISDVLETKACQINFCGLPECAAPVNSAQHFGISGFSVTDPSLWYTIETNSFPDTVPLSQGRNRGSVEGGVYLSPTGFTIGEAGNYWVSISAVLQNISTDTSTLMVPVFLVVDDVLDPENPLLGGIVTLPSNELQTLNVTSILRDVTPGTRLSLVATNAGYPTPQPVNVAAWSISLFKM